MDVTPLIRDGTQIIQSYSENGFKVSGERYTQAILVMPELTIMWCDKTSMTDLSIDDFTTQPLKDFDVLLLGTGNTLIFPDPSLRKTLKEHAIKTDVMDTGAACRTYNVLVAEGRRVAALLLPL